MILIFSLTAVPGFATGEKFTVSLVATSDAAGKNPIEGVTAGEQFYIRVLFSGNTKESNVRAFDLSLKYNAELFTVAQESDFVGIGLCTSAVGNGLKGEGIAHLGWAATNGLYDAENDEICTEGALGRLKITAKEDISSPKMASFEIDTNATFFSTTSDNTGKIEYDVENMTFLVSVPNSIAITGDDTIAAPVASDGTAQQTTKQYSAVVIGESGIISNPSVTWSITGDNNNVTINSSGVVTVKSGAAAGDYTITATATVEGTELVGEKTIKVTKDDLVATSITVSGGSTGPIYVPGDKDEDETATFTATVTDQYGDTMNNPVVEWSVSPVVDGISIAGGVLTVTNAAKTSIDTEGKTLTVTATCGEKSDTATVTVKRAASTHSSIEILKGDKAITSDNIAAGETGNYTAKYYDQYGYEMEPPPGATPNWSMSEFKNCAYSDFALEIAGKDAIVKVDDSVENGASATLTVTEENLTDSITINVDALTFTAEEGAVTFYYPEDEKAVYGPTWEELVQIDQDKITATFQGKPVEGTYYLKVSEDYGTTFNDVDQKARPVYDSSIALYMCSIYFDSEDETFKDIYVAKHCTSSTNVPDILFSLYPKPVTVSGITVTDKVYDGTTDATIDCTNATVNEADIVGEDVVGVTNATGATGKFDSKDVGNGKTVTITGLTLTGADAANYKLSTPVTTTGNITKRPVTVSVDGVSVTKVYDGTTAASTSNISGQVTLGDVISEDNVDVSVVTVGDYSSAAVGTNYEVTLNLQLTGEDATNYTLPAAPVTATASITASSNITDTTAAAQNVVVGVGTFTEPKFTGIGGEAVTGTVTYSYGDETDYNHDYAYIVNALKSLSKGQTATIGYSFTPTDSNYTGTITGTITVTMVDIVFTVDGEPATADNAVTIKDNPTYGDTWSEIVTIKEDDIVATLSGETLYGGTYSLNVSDMPDAGGQDYTVRYTYEGKTYDVCSGTVTVARRALTITGIGAEDKEYNGTTAATVTGTATLKGLVGTDTFTVSNGTAAFASKDAGTQTVTFTGFSITGEGADNYTLTQPDSVTATISPKPVTITGVTAENKTYDGNTTATIDNPGTINGIISPDTVTIKAGTGTFAGADVGENIEVTFSGFSLTGTDSGNYTLSAQPASTIANITKANYTGTPNTVNVNVLINQSAAQTGSVSIDQFFQTIPAGAAIKEVSSTDDLVIADMDISDDGKVITYTSKANLTTENEKDTYTVTIETKNYNDIEATLTFTTVAKTPVNISGVSVTGAGKTYDGKAVSYTGTPAAKTNDGKTVTVTGTYSYVWQKADGTALASAPKDAGSYKLVITLDDPAYIGSAEVSFTIAKAKITITAEDAEAYTGSDMPKLSYTVSGLATGEKLAKEPSISCAADMKKAGSYVIAVSGAEVPNTNNYEETITYVSGTLEVKNRPVNIGPTYDIKVLDSAHGTVRASLGNASEGSTIRLTVTPDEGYSLANLIVRDERGRRIDVAKSGGVYRFVMPAGDVTIEAVFAQGTTVLPFTDVSTYDWFYEYVKYVYDNGIMDGIDVGVFGPGITTTRAMLVTMLYRVAGEPYVSGTNDFADVAANTWYTDAVTWASKNGIVTGVDVGVFNPNGAITREQLATILYRYAEYVGEDVSARASLSRFTDTGSISAYARDAMSWAVAEGILDGRTATELAPTGECTRAEVATMIARAFG